MFTTKVVYSKNYSKKYNLFDIFYNNKKVLKNNELLIFIESVCEFFKLKHDLIFSIESSVHSVSKEFQVNLRNIVMNIKKGISFSDSIEQEDIFPDYAKRIIKIAEKNNDFLETFSLLKNLISFKIQQQNKLNNAIIQPLFTFCVFVGIFFLFSNFIAPSIFDMLNSLNPNSNYDSFLNYVFGFKLFLAFITIVLCYLFFLKKYYASKFEKTILYIPFFKDLQQLQIIYLLSYSIYISLKSGLQFIEIINLLINCEKNNTKHLLIQIRDELRKGSSISSAFINTQFFPKFFQDILQTGENSENIENSFLLIKDIAYGQYEKKMNLFIFFFPVCIIFFTAIMLILFITMIFLPIYEIGEIL